MRTDLPLWRSVLYVPANVERFVAKAHTRGADAVILDLEDAVLPDDKPAARAAVPEAAKRVGQAGADVLVRINRPWRMAFRDLEAVVGPAVAALAIPKVADASHVRAICEILDDLEAERGMAPGHTRLVAMVETASAWFRLEEVAKADPRVVALVVGSEDFALSTGMLPEPEGLFMPTLAGVIAARAAGIVPMGFMGSIADFRDRDTFRQRIRQARRLGFLGSMCIHPDQVAILNEEFAPSAEEVSFSRRVLAADAEARAAGRGSFALDGRMIDIPIVERARQTVARADAIAAKTG